MRSFLGYNCRWQDNATEGCQCHGHPDGITYQTRSIELTVTNQWANFMFLLPLVYNTYSLGLSFTKVLPELSPTWANWVLRYSSWAPVLLSETIEYTPWHQLPRLLSAHLPLLSDGEIFVASSVPDGDISDEEGHHDHLKVEVFECDLYRYQRVSMSSTLAFCFHVTFTYFEGKEVVWVLGRSGHLDDRRDRSDGRRERQSLGS